MDAHAHLLSLGWAGPGHSLDSRPYKQKGHRGLAYDPAKVGNNGNGLVKPILISQRKGRLGIGKKAHEPPAGTEWWLKGFESALGNIGKTESESSSGTSTPVVPQNGGGKHGWLYSFFVKGQEMQGTIGKDGTMEDLSNGKKRRSDVLDSKKRKSDVLESTEEDQDEDALQSDTMKKKKKQKQNPVVEFEQVSTYIALRDKDEKPRKRAERPSPVEEFRQVSEYLEVRSEKKRKRKEKHRERIEESGTSTPAVTEGEGEEAAERLRTETKEERRERRRRRREEKERQKDALDAHNSAAASDRQSEDDAAAKAARRAERKKRKAGKEAAKAATPS